jgi:hypothetical protein
MPAARRHAEQEGHDHDRCSPAEQRPPETVEPGEVQCLDTTPQATSSEQDERPRDHGGERRSQHSGRRCDGAVAGEQLRRRRAGPAPGEDSRDQSRHPGGHAQAADEHAGQRTAGDHDDENGVHRGNLIASGRGSGVPAARSAAAEAGVAAPSRGARDDREHLLPALSRRPDPG